MLCHQNRFDERLETNHPWRHDGRYGVHVQLNAVGPYDAPTFAKHRTPQFYPVLSHRHLTFISDISPTRKHITAEVIYKTYYRFDRNTYRGNTFPAHPWNVLMGIDASHVRTVGKAWGVCLRDPGVALSVLHIFCFTFFFIISSSPWM